MKTHRLSALGLSLLLAAASWAAPGLHQDGTTVTLVRDDGSLWSWGDYRPVFISDYLEARLPTRLGDGFIEAVSGGDFSLGLRADGSVWGWGALGTAERIPFSRARRVMEGVKSLDARNGVALALGQNGDLWRLRGLWANEAVRSVCGAERSISQSPQRLGRHMREMRSAADAVFAIGNDGRLWGQSLSKGDPFVAIGLDPDGEPWQGFEPAGGSRIQAASGKWYQAEMQQRDDCTTPLVGWAVKPAEAPAADPLAGMVYPNAVLAQSNGLQCLNQPGQPGYLNAAALRSVTLNRAGDTFLAQDRSGRVFGCGASQSNLLGTLRLDEVNEPVELPDQYAVVAPEASHTLGIDAQGVVWSWGEGSRRGMDTDPQQPWQRYERLRIGEGFRAVAAGPWFDAGIREDGSLWVWGAGAEGKTYLAPTRILAGQTFQAVIERNSLLRGKQLAAQRSDGRWVVLDYPTSPEALAQGRFTLKEMQDEFRSISRRHEWFWQHDGQILRWGLDMPNGQILKVEGVGALSKVWLDDPLIRVLDVNGRLIVMKQADGKLTPSARLEEVADSVLERESRIPGNGTYLVVRRDGSLWRWFSDFPESPSGPYANPVKLGEGFQSLHGNGSSTLLQKRDGRLWGMGQNQQRQLGVGPVAYQFRPSEIPLDGTAQFSAKVDGPMKAQSLSARITPAQADLGQKGHYFVVAQAKDLAGLFSFDGKDWYHHADTTLKALDEPRALSERSLELLQKADISALAGATLYLGYGLGDTAEAAQRDMMARKLWNEVYVVQ
ncbi:hypothetical protein [Chitinimonas lacunae]|uniref:Uncharacterized protein n=1 Tax=Chitinimonas lacunae TaxID=1963018 RepID=A0ABV8MUK8_9NEIS